jgi:response regulator of citrate/malate metabolism
MLPAKNGQLKILLVEDHVAIARLTSKIVEEINCMLVGPARSIHDAMQLATKHLPDVALVDLSLPDGSGEDLIHRLQGLGVYCAVVSAYAKDFKQIDDLDHVPWLEKPLTVDQLKGLVSEFASRKVDT